MDELLEFKSDKATYTARAGDDLLGGGQTAAVYRVRADDDRIYALKWLTESVYEQRFFQEVDWLNELAHAPEAYGLKRNGQLLTPRVYDEQRQGKRRFFVMDLAPGQPLDEALRHRGRLPEPVALAIAAQLARVFTALHETLRRSYLDFQPRNVFWQEQSGQIMVIDWNLLSPKDRPDVATDLRSIGTLLYRMLLGALPPTGESGARGRVATQERWQKISLGARVLLQNLLEPRPGQRIEEARTARDRLDELCQRWERSGDDLVREAAALFKQVKNGDAKATSQDAALLDVAVCLDLAGRQTGALALSNAMAMVRNNLEQEVAGRRQALTALARGISFFRSGDLDTVPLLFEQALTEAERPEDELQVRRWLTVLAARHQYPAGFDGLGRQRIETLLDVFQSATRAYLDRSLASQPDLSAWREVKAEAETLGKDIGAVGLLAVEAASWPVVLALLARDWSEIPGESLHKRFMSALEARDAIAGLPYADDLWSVLGVGDDQASGTAVADAISILEDAVQAERRWLKLWRDARNDRWSRIDDDEIRHLFEEAGGVLPNLKPVFGLLSIALGKRQDSVATTLLEGLATSAGLTESDCRRVQAFEQWLNRMRRVEQFVNVWSAEDSAAASGVADQRVLARTGSSGALNATSTEDSVVLDFPASWVLNELSDLSRESFVNDIRERIEATATQAVRICIRQESGLSLAKLIMNRFAEEQIIMQHNKDWSELHLKLDSIQLDEKLRTVRQRIDVEQERLNDLVAAVSDKERNMNEVDKEVEAHRIKRMSEVENDLDKKRLLCTQELEGMQRQITEQRDSLALLTAEKKQQFEDLERLRVEKKGLESPPATIARYEETVKALQDKIKRLENEIDDPERLGRIAEKRLQERDDRIGEQQATIKELSQQNQQLQLKTQNLEARLGQRLASPSDVQLSVRESGWQRVYEATKLVQSGVLSDVRNALDVWKVVAQEAESNGDSKLLKEANALILKWEPSYEQNLQKWLSTSGVLQDLALLEQATQTLEELLASGIRGYTRQGETQKRLAQLRLDVVEAIDNALRSGGLSPQQYYDALQKAYGYTNKAGQLAQLSKDPEVQESSRRIRQIYDGWVKPRTP